MLFTVKVEYILPTLARSDERFTDHLFSGEVMHSTALSTRPWSKMLVIVMLAFESMYFRWVDVLTSHVQRLAITQRGWARLLNHQSIGLARLPSLTGLNDLELV